LCLLSGNGDLRFVKVVVTNSPTTEASE
jgi:hypothetical protein